MYIALGFAAVHVAALLVSLAMLLSAWRWPRLARIEYVALFAWACWMNWTTVTRSPSVYFDYGGLAVVPAYRTFIEGPFRHQVVAVVGTIATLQGLIALGLVIGGAWARAALVGAIVFLVAVAPLGVGSGFPSTLIMAAGAFVLYRARTPLRGAMFHALGPAA